ncbi:hypothetical protein M970_040440 [Encephalitozoon cuniculi EcunIII-L]|nr:hypothetical protein M970_040440 [Encephalitozoon cuniculi EcunIII-L]
MKVSNSKSHRKNGHCRLILLRLIHMELEKNSNPALRWIDDGQAFEVRGRIKIPSVSEGSGVVVIKRRGLEKILFMLGFQKRESVRSHIYFHRHFKKGESVDESKMHLLYTGIYTGGFPCPSRWKDGGVDVREWYRHVCDMYASVREMLSLQDGIIEGLWSEITRVMMLGVKEMKGPFEYRRYIVRGDGKPFEERMVGLDRREETSSGDFVEIIGGERRDRIQEFV